MDKSGNFSRRDFLRASATAAAGVGLTGLAGCEQSQVEGMASKVHTSGSDKIKLGLIGCGGRGRYDTTQCLTADANVELTAMADLFADQLVRTLEGLKTDFG